ncbi:MAG: heavy metal-associated domain-containing protein [Bacteroidetes bacterium HGW-Bacteroidetes-1]|jgi:hypothetical protein|nr:MAG: heavy metal-associated domain-containing protein [Bacteroidetes bacterium HGW-Bacteroidetes-1]
MNYITAYFLELFNLFNAMAPYLLFGFFFAGLLKVFFPKRLLTKYMGKSNAAASFNASLLGIPMPLCSCGVLPTGISLYRNGASRGSTNSFLISTPQTGVDSILVTYSMLGLPFAVIRPIIALITGFFGGVLTNVFDPEKKENIENQPKTIQEETPRTLAYMLKYAFVDFLQDISKWLIIGLLVAALISVLLPDDFFTSYVSNDFVGMIIILVASIPLYVCATASVPIAAVLLLKGLSPGAILVFLMAGPATNFASITVLSKTMGKKSTLIYLFTIIAGALTFGVLVNLLPTQWFELTQTHQHHEHGEILPYWLQIFSSFTLFLLILNVYYQKNFSKKDTIMSNNQNEFSPEFMTVKVSGMDCNHCKVSVETNLKKIENIAEVIANLQTQSVEIKGDNIDLEKVKSTVESLGYTYGGKL